MTQIVKYRFKVKRFYRYFPLFSLPIFSFMFLYGSINALLEGALLRLIPAFIMGFVVLTNFSEFINMIVKIDIYEDGEIIFRTITGKCYSLRAEHFRTIKFIKKQGVVYALLDRTFVTWGKFKRFSEFLRIMEEANPKINTYTTKVIGQK